jgi:glycosyltransferase involved in cell wall biosynthesis
MIAIVCVTNDLSTDQRVHKTCLALMKCGYQVTEYGRILPGSLPLNRTYITHRVKHFFNRGPLFYAEYNIRLFFYLLFNQSTLIFSNDLDTLPAAFLASKIKRNKIIYDSHEYYTETPELVNRPFVQGIWKKIESAIFPHLTKIITVNNSIAALFEKKYAKKVAVIRNIPLTFKPEVIKTRQELGLPEDRKILLIQGTGINVDRGAEEACLAMEYLEGYILLIIGSGDVFPTLKKIVAEKKLEDKVMFKNKMDFRELRQFTINSDLGLTIDKDTNINYRFSLPNKLFDFMHAGIPVLSTGLVELKRIIDEYNTGFFIENHDPKHIADVIKSIFNDMKTYMIKKEKTLYAAKELCWEEEEKKLFKIILRND